MIFYLPRPEKKRKIRVVNNSNVFIMYTCITCFSSMITNLMCAMFSSLLRYQSENETIEGLQA